MVSAAHDRMNAELQHLARTALAGQEILQENRAVFSAFFGRVLERIDDVEKQVFKSDAVSQELVAVRGDIESNMRDAVGAIIRSHSLDTQNICELVTSEYAVTRQCLADAIAREHVATQALMEALLAKNLATNTRTTIELVRSEYSETSMRLVASISGLGLTINSLQEDRAQLARMETRLKDLFERIEAISDVVDMVRRVRLPGLPQLHLGWHLVKKCFALLTDAPVTLTSRDVITGTVILAFTARQSHFRSACAVIAVSLFVWRQVRGVMYRCQVYT